MPILLRTLKVGNQHTHFVYLVEPEGDAPPMAVSSITKGHKHDIVFDVSPGPDGMPSGQPRLVILEYEGHSHEIEGEYTPPLPERKFDENELVSRVEGLYATAKRINAKSMNDGWAAERAYMHDQWDDNVVRKLHGEDRAALTINKLEQKVDNLCGYQRQNRTDLKFYPMENGDQAVADILNIVVRNVLENCYYGREESKVFEDAVVPGKGDFNVYVDFDRRVDGEIIVERFPWDQVLYGPHEKEDLSDCEYLVKSRWFSLEKLEELYPDVAFTADVRDPDMARTQSEDWDGSNGQVEVTGGDDGKIKNARKEYRLVECWQREQTRTFILANARDGFTLSAEGWSKADIAAAKTIPGMRAIPRITSRMRVTKIAGHKLLDDEYPELALQDFHTFPLYAKYRRGRFHGKLKGVLDLQLLINKCYSQFVDIINKVTNYGWFYDDQTFPSSREQQNWLSNAAKPGFNQKLSDVTKPPQKVEGQRFPSELVNALAMFSNDMREIMNINLEMLGQGQQDQSGVALRQKILQQLVGNDFLFDNLSFVKKKIGKLIVAYIQKFYTPRRIMRIILNENKREPVQLGGQPIPMQDSPEPQENDPSAIEALLREADLTQYDIVVSESPSSPSAMMSNFLLLLDMASKGIPIPPQAVLDFAPIPNKNRILEQIAQSQQQQQAQETMKYDTEIKKAVIAQQGGAAQGQAMAGPLPAGVA